MYCFSDVKRLHLELTTRCNASCPQCPRNMSGDRLNPHLPMAELGLQDVRCMLPPEALVHVRAVLLCGNYGDPMVARDLVPIIDYLKSAQPNLRVTMNTNGSAHTPKFWCELADRVDEITFGIDGLEDTHALYRRGTAWERVVEHARAFIAAGGRANWDYLVFRHNEHQVEDARTLIQALGFARFTVKRTSRFLHAGKMTPRTPVYERDTELSYYLEVPQADENLNDAARVADRLSQIPAGKGRTQYDTYLEQTPINCRAWREQQIYISAEGLVFPCCWTGALYNGVPRQHHPIWKRIDALPNGVADIDAKRTALRDIIDGPFMQASIPSGWASGASADRLKICARACGKLDAWAAMYTPSQNVSVDEEAQ